MFDALREAKLRAKIHGLLHWKSMYSSHPLPYAISHRGLRSSAPENTIAAFLAAVEAGAEGVELDVHSSSDGMVFVHHDFTIPVAGGVAPIAGTSSDELRKIRLEGDHAIPALDEVIEAIPAHVRLFIEIKPQGIEGDVVRCLKRHEDRITSLAVHSFDHRIVKRVIEAMPSIRTGVLQVGYPIDSRAVMRAAGASDLWQHVDFVDSRLVADVRAAEGRLITWTANDPSQWKRLSELGVDGICTDHVDEYLQWRNSEAVGRSS